MVDHGYSIKKTLVTKKVHICADVRIIRKGFDFSFPYIGDWCAQKFEFGFNITQLQGVQDTPVHKKMVG